jgi:hypothetical protein
LEVHVTITTNTQHRGYMSYQITNRIWTQFNRLPITKEWDGIKQSIDRRARLFSDIHACNPWNLTWILHNQPKIKTPRSVLKIQINYYVIHCKNILETDNLHFQIQFKSYIRTSFESDTLKWFKYFLLHSNKCWLGIR